MSFWASGAFSYRMSFYTCWGSIWTCLPLACVSAAIPLVKALIVALHFTSHPFSARLPSCRVARSPPFQSSKQRRQKRTRNDRSREKTRHVASARQGQKIKNERMQNEATSKKKCSCQVSNSAPEDSCLAALTD